jgi:hypothetical protein
VFLYDSTVVDVFISLEGNGSVILEYIKVTATNNTATTATKTLVSVKGGTVDVTLFVFESFKSSVPVFHLNESGVLHIDEISVTNLTFTDEGCFISGTGDVDLSSKLDILTSNFSSISGSNVSGSVIKARGISLVNIHKCNFNGTSGLGDGGAFYIANCTNISINASSFDGFITQPLGKGGAIYFGENTTFSIINSTFANCSALYGGAVFTDSEVATLREIVFVTFINNSVAAEEGNGNDIADNSSVALSIYTVHSVLNSTSSSTSNVSTIFNFYMIQEGVEFDCLLSGLGCGHNPAFVSAAGADSDVCGSPSSPCQTVSRVIQNLRDMLDPQGEIIVAYGIYTNTVITVYSLVLGVTTNTVNKPVFSLISPPIGLIMDIFY